MCVRNVLRQLQAFDARSRIDPKHLVDVQM